MVGVVADELLDRIIAGEFPPGASVPGELELSARHEVSRMTVREAIKTLEAQRILSVERGRGTFVNPLNRWASLEAVLRAASEGKNDAAAAVQLIELRRMLESGACELAAVRIGDADLESLYAHLEAMRDARGSNNVAAFVEADLAFHDLILKASENVFAAVLFEPLHRILEKRRTETSKVPDIQEHAIWHHEQVA
ncbi:MAG: FadR family transcriptional regulator, partial [Arthrobacter sp.]|nr:FadR family transcriptional regulator [Arthrobacter sp.]